MVLVWAEEGTDLVSEELKSIVETDAPRGAKVTFEAGESASGWHAPATAPWLKPGNEGADPMITFSSSENGYWRLIEQFGVAS